jgi:hypothetical protein
MNTVAAHNLIVDHEKDVHNSKASFLITQEHGNYIGEQRAR